MDLDSIITLVLVALMIIGPVLSAVVIILNVKMSKRIKALTVKLDEMESHTDEKLKGNENLIKDELSRQRRMLTESLTSINDNVTRGVNAKK